MLDQENMRLRQARQQEDLIEKQKLQMMEQIGESLQQEQVMRGTNSTSSVVSATSMERGDDHKLYLLREQPC